MTTIQMALEEALPRVMAEARRSKSYERAVERGRELMLEATRHTIDHQPEAALRAVSQDREACACYLAQRLRRPVMASKGKKSGFSELALMEEFWREKVEPLSP